MRKAIFAAICISFLSACASSPDDLDSAYVSPLKYRGYDCDQVGMEMDYVGQRTGQLYHRLKNKREKDNVQMGVGLILFWPSLFFLEGGDGPDAAEYSQLKGEYEALRKTSVEKKCSIMAKSPEQIINDIDRKDKQLAQEKAKNELGVAQ